MRQLVHVEAVAATDIRMTRVQSWGRAVVMVVMTVGVMAEELLG